MTMAASRRQTRRAAVALLLTRLLHHETHAAATPANQSGAGHFCITSHRPRPCNTACAPFHTSTLAAMWRHASPAPNSALLLSCRKHQPCWSLPSPSTHHAARHLPLLLSRLLAALLYHHCRALRLALPAAAAACSLALGCSSGSSPLAWRRTC